MTTLSVLEMYRGDDRTLTVTADESLEGSVVRFTAKWSRHRDAEAIIAKSSEVDGEIAIDDAVATVTIDAADTDDLLPGPLYWDVEITDALAKVRTVAVGQLLIRSDVTGLGGS